MARPEIVPAAHHHSRLVVTLATIPSRIAHIGPVIASIKAQKRRPDQIYLCISEICLRDQSPYEIPDWLQQDESVEIVVSAQDYGPATKLIGMLDREPDPQTRIVIVDDDFAYRADMVEQFERRFEEYGRAAALGCSGGRIPRHWSQIDARIGPEIEARPQLRHQFVFIAESPKDVPVDILQYGFGAIVLRGWFGDDIRALVEPLEPLFFADDVLFSGYLASKGVQRICIGGMQLPQLLGHRNTRPLHGDGRATRNLKAGISTLAERLRIWAPDNLFDPRPPRHVVVRYQVSRALRAVYRVMIRPLVALMTRSH